MPPHDCRQEPGRSPVLPGLAAQRNHDARTPCIPWFAGGTAEWTAPTATRHRVPRLDKGSAPHHNLWPPLKFHLEAAHDPEEPWPGAPRSPEQVGVLLGDGTHKLAFGGNDLNRSDTGAGWSPQPRIPAEPALQQKASESHGHTVARRKEQVELAQSAVEMGAS